MAVVAYVAVDIAMDVLLFPRLPEHLKEHHREVVTRHAIFFGLLPVWIVGLILFEKRQNRIGALVFASALFATVGFAFTSLPFIWAASAVPSLATPLLFLHDHGLVVYFVLLLSTIIVREAAKPNDRSPPPVPPDQPR